MTLTDADLARLEALDKAATAGPWTLATRGSSYAKCPQCDQGEYIARALPSTYGPENHNTEADAELIVEYRNRTPDLVAELREARAALARVKALCEQAEHGEGIVITPGFVTYYSVECGLLRDALADA